MSQNEQRLKMAEELSMTMELINFFSENIEKEIIDDATKQKMKKKFYATIDCNSMEPPNLIMLQYLSKCLYELEIYRDEMNCILLRMLSDMM